MNEQSACARGADLVVALAAGGSVNLADFCGQKLVVFFCGGGDAAAAQLEIESYERLAGDFQRAGGWVLGIANPGFTPASGRVAESHVHLGLDPDGTAFNALAARFPTVDLDGRGGATILIDRDGVARQAWPGTGHAAEALIALRERR